MGRFSRDEFLTKYPDSQNVVIPHHIYLYTYKEDISVERARQYLNLSQDAFIVTAFGKFRNREEIAYKIKFNTLLEQQNTQRG